MQSHKFRSFFTLAGALFATSVSLQASAVTTGDNGTHDPSRIVESEGRFWVYSTGGGSKSSPDGLKWTNGPRTFPNGFPDWLNQRLPTTQGLWAPDIIRLNDQYYQYYSVASGSGKKSCAIGLVTSPTLNPDSPNYKWTDGGLIAANDEVVKYAAIDPAPFLDADENLWVVWGGGYANPTDADAIWVTRLDNKTGKPSSEDNERPGHPILKGHKEGPYIHYHGGYYYVFWQTGGCCSGTSSTYTIHMARSKSVTGPYEGDQVFDSSHEDVHGPGHIGIYDDCGVQVFTYHYYPSSGSILGLNQLQWDNDGWPVAGPDITTPLKPCGMTGGGSSSSNRGGSGGMPPSVGGSSGNAQGGSANDSGGQTSPSLGGSSTGTAGNTSAGGTGTTTSPIPSAGTGTVTSAGGANAGSSDDASNEGGCNYGSSRSKTSGVASLLLAIVGFGALRRRSNV